MLEEDRKPFEAYTILRECLHHFGSTPMSTNIQDRTSGDWTSGKVLSAQDHIRAIGLSQKLGQLALVLYSAPKVTVYPNQPGVEGSPTNWLDAAEKHLSEALTAMLKLGLAPSEGGDGKSQRVIAGRDVNLPAGPAAVKNEEGEMEQVNGGGVDRKGLGVTMEALAEVYARKGDFAIAGNLLIQSISTLLPPGSDKPGAQKPPIEDQCQAAMVCLCLFLLLSHLDQARQLADDIAHDDCIVTRPQTSHAKSHQSRKVLVITCSSSRRWRYTSCCSGGKVCKHFGLPESFGRRVIQSRHISRGESSH